MKRILKHHRLKPFNVAVDTLVWVLALVAAKYSMHAFRLEFLQINSLTGSAIAGGTFICSFLLSGLIADYKEAERVPAEMRSSLDSIWEEGNVFKRKVPAFKLDDLKESLRRITHLFFRGVSHDENHANLGPCIDAVNGLSFNFAEMEDKGMPPNYVVRLKSEQAVLRKNLLRVHHIQRTQFLPSAYILAESIVVLIVFLLLFIKTEGSPESMFLFGFISYMFIYITRLIRRIEQPFQEGDSTLDDVSLFLLHDFENKLGARAA